MRSLIFVPVLFFTATLNVSAQQEKSDASKTLRELLKSSKGLKTFSKRLEMDEFLFNFTDFGDTPFTVFIPSDAATSEIDKRAKTDKEKYMSKLLKGDVYVKQHLFITKKITSKQLKEMARNKKPLQNFLTDKKYKVSVKGDSILLEDVKITQADILCKGGVVHVIDGAFPEIERKPGR